MLLRCIIVDDEPFALDLLENYIRKTPFLELAGRYGSALELLHDGGARNSDILFLDIQMPELSGIEFSRLFDGNARIVFTTAFSEYALEGYRVNAIDYLLKPFNYEEFLRAAGKARNWFETTSSRDNAPGRFIFVKSDYKLLKIDLHTVLYFEGLKDYVKIRSESSDKTVMTLLSLKALEQELPAGKFMRIHRSFIINLEKVTAIERGQVIMLNNERITVADQYRERFQQFVAGKSIQ